MLKTVKISENIESIKIKVLVISALLVIMLAHSASSQWVQLEGVVNPAGDYPSISVLDNNIMVIGGSDKTVNKGILWKTNNGGSNYTEVPFNGIDMSGKSISAVKIISENIIFIGEGNINGNIINNARVLKSINGGSTWTELITTGSQKGYINGIVFSEVNPMFGIVISDPHRDSEPVKIWKTTDGGSNWILTYGMTNSKVGKNSVFVIDEDFYGYGSNSSTIRFTSDGGNTWNESELNGINSLVSGIAFDNSKTYGIAVSYNNPQNKLSRTSDGGLTWQSVTLPGDKVNGTASVQWVPGTPSVYVTISNDKKSISYRSFNNGESWDVFEFPQNATGITHFDLHYDNISGNATFFSTSSSSSTYKLEDAPLPVTLQSFTYSLSGNNVNLFWSTSMEENNSGFEIYRKELNDNQWKKSGFLKGKGNSNSVVNYSFSDKNLSSGKYNYKLKQIDYNGNYEYFELEGTIEIGVPEIVVLSQNYPNPFNPVTKIDYKLSADSFVNIRVYDMSGREISTLVNSDQTSGYYTVIFDGSRLSSGIYFYKLTVTGNKGEKTEIIKRMTLVK